MNHNISASRLCNTAEKVYGQEAQAPLAALLTQYGFSETVEVFQEAPGDGVISIPYRVFQGRSVIQGVLRFASDGSVYDGLNKLNAKLGVGVASLVVTSAFGEEELGQKSNGLDTEFLKSALHLYECLNSGFVSGQTCLDKTDEELASIQRTRSDAAKIVADLNEQKTKETERLANIAKVRSLIDFADQVKNIAIREDQGPFGWDKDAVIEILNEELPVISATPPDTVEGSRDQVTRAYRMADRLLGISEGRDSCKKILWCNVLTGSEPNCSANATGFASVTYSYHGESLHHDPGGCVEHPKQEKLENPCAGGSCLDHPNRQQKFDPTDRVKY